MVSLRTHTIRYDLGLSYYNFNAGPFIVAVTIYAALYFTLVVILSLPSSSLFPSIVKYTRYIIKLFTLLS